MIPSFEDDEGASIINMVVPMRWSKTDHDAYTYPDEPKDAYCPIVEILEKLGVEITV